MFGACARGRSSFLAAVFAPCLAPHDPAEQFRDGLTPDGLPVPSTLPSGSGRFPLGTDANGRDLLSRMLYGARVSLTGGRARQCAGGGDRACWSAR